MSNSQHLEYEPYGGGGPSVDLHNAETVAYGVYAAPGTYDDTYRPAYEAYEPPPPPRPPQPRAPRPAAPMPSGPGPAQAAPGPRPSPPDGPYDSYAPHEAYAPNATGETYETGETGETYETYGPDAAYDLHEPYAPHGPHGLPAARPRPPRTLQLPEPLVLPGPGPESGRAGRRRRARSAERPESPMRRLLPQALVVAFLAGGTTAFVAEDKAVELTVDGKPRTLHTFADDVGELLAEEGVKVGAHDMVAPAPGTALTSGDEIAVRYGRPVRLTLDGERHELWTTAPTVEEALRRLGVRAEGAYMSVSRAQPIGRAGLALDVRTERSVTVMADGRARTVRTNAATVRDVVRAAGITLRGQDTTSVDPGSFPRDGQTVTVLRITGSQEVREEQIPFAVRRTEDPSLFKGIQVVERTGQPGLRRVTYSLRTVNGVRQRPRRIRDEVVRAPRTQVVKVGTKPRPTSVRGADGLNWQSLAACESGGRPNAVDPSGTYGGLYQFDTRTWQSLGGSGRPQDASAQEQTFRAKKLYVRRGASPWPHCGTRLHG
ncbi:ubiquitin-like domain-containing protein [Streptomyces sp. NPDC021608]|uniref:ubiquitin-like domain-containing protein n=1 Tax=Streptomyces sp. NPDC021608 TaxID=3154903 RepID=UPI00340EAAA0